MAEPRPVVPLLLVVAAFSRHADVLAWAREQIEGAFGTIALESIPFDFVQTRYYAPTMGEGLEKCFLVCEELILPDRFAEVKLRTNQLEADAARIWAGRESRPLNLDPGLLSLGKFMLATTKDQAHRIYLRDGIYAEVTLHYHAGQFVIWPWTYADYQLPGVRDFLACAREFYRLRLANKHR
jgi:hypothetical protein